MSGLNDLILPNGPHVILNTRQKECRWCKKVHETITHNCRPVVFLNPQKMELHVRKTTKDRITLTKTAVETLVTANSVGTPQAISVTEALKLDPEYRSRHFNQ